MASQPAIPLISAGFFQIINMANIKTIGNKVSPNSSIDMLFSIPSMLPVRPLVNAVPYWKLGQPKFINPYELSTRILNSPSYLSTYLIVKYYAG